MKLADTTIIIRRLASKGLPEPASPPTSGCAEVAKEMATERDPQQFVSKNELKDLATDGEAPDVKLEEEDDEEAPLKKACAYQLGMQYAWKEAGIEDDLRRHLLLKVAMALHDGTLKTPKDFQDYQPKLAAEAAELLGYKVKTAVNVDPTMHLLLMALAGASIGGTGGYLVDRIKEKVLGKKSKSNLAVTGALGGAGAGALKHMYDLHTGG